MIQIIGDFIRTKGYLIGRGVGILFIIAAAIIHYRGGSYYSYYDTKRHKKEEMSIYIPYAIGAFIIWANRKKPRKEELQ